jgi:hypothetical protein
MFCAEILKVNFLHDVDGQPVKLGLLQPMVLVVSLVLFSGNLLQL